MKVIWNWVLTVGRYLNKFKDILSINFTNGIINLLLIVKIVSVLFGNV